MTFKEFLQNGPVKHQKNSVSRLFNASKSVLPARPVRIVSVRGPMTKPTLLK